MTRSSRALLLTGLVTAAGTFAACAQVLGIQPFQEGGSLDGGADAGAPDAPGVDSAVPDGGPPPCCAAAEQIPPLNAGETRSLAGTLTAGAGTFDIDLSTSQALGLGCTTAAGPEHVYAVPAAASGVLTASLDRTGTDFDSVLYARSDCCAESTMVLCADSTGCPAPLHGGEVLSFPVQAGDTWYVIVDSRFGSAHGAYALTLSLRAGDTCAAKVPITISPGSPQVLLGDNHSAGTDPGQSTVLNCPPQAGFFVSGWARQIIYDVSPGPGVTSIDYQIEHAANVCDAGSCAANAFDSVLYASRPGSTNACGGSNMLKTVSYFACNDNRGQPTPTGEQISADGGEAFVFVDSSEAKDCCGNTGGTYRLRVTPHGAGECADGGLDGGDGG